MFILVQALTFLIYYWAIPKLMARLVAILIILRMIQIF